MLNFLIIKSYGFLMNKKLKNTSLKSLKERVRLRAALMIILEFVFLLILLTCALILLSFLIDEVSIRDLGLTSNEFINGVRLNIFESFVQTIKYSFTGNSPSFAFSPFLTNQLLNNYENTIWFMVFSLLLSILLSVFHILFRIHVQSKKIRKIGDRFIYLNMVLPGVTVLILVSAFTIPLNGNSFLSFDINNPLDWLMPVCLASLPLSTFLSKRIWELYSQWTVSLEKKLFKGMIKKKAWANLKVFWKLHWYEIFAIILFMFIGLIMFVGSIEYAIDFPGIGSFFVNSLKKNDIWVIEPILCWFLYILFATFFVLNINRWRQLNTTIWRREING